MSVLHASQSLSGQLLVPCGCPRPFVRVSNTGRRNRTATVQHVKNILSCTNQLQHRRRATSVVVLASRGDDKDSQNDEQNSSAASDAGVPAGLLLFVGSLAFTLTNMRDELSDLLYSNDSLGDFGIAGFGLGDAFAALLWSVALWYVSPWQLLLVFLGKIETDRPSDWIINRLGRAAGLDTEEITYAAPLWTRAVAAATCLAGGVAVAVLLESGLGDPTWAVSSGIGALFAAAIFEVGRPKRLTVAEAQQLEAQWQDFAAFAQRRLQRSGRCHESEVFAAFRRTSGKYRSTDVLTDSTLRDMVRNWHPGVERTRTGYYKNISLQSLVPVSSQSSDSRKRSSAEVEEQQDGGLTLLDSIVSQQQQQQQAAKQQDGEN